MIGAGQPLDLRVRPAGSSWEPGSCHNSLVVKWTRLTSATNCCLCSVSRFTYDAFSRRVKIEEGTASGSTFTPNTSLTRNFVWVGGEIAEERDNSNVVQKKFFGMGEWRNGVGSLYYSRDHLGSLRELTDGSGTVRARYEYDPYGRRSANLVTATNALAADWGFTGHYYHEPSQLHLAWFRAYDAKLGRWISRDPIAEADGLNLYGYVGGDPVNLRDPLGLWIEDEDGFPVLVTGTALDALFYDEATKAEHDAIMANAKAALIRGGKAVAEEAAMACVPLGRFVKAGKALKNAGEVGIQLTKSSLKLGQEMHKAYKAGLADGVNTFKEFNKIKGIRPDFVDFTIKTIYELKPYNPRAIREGLKQLDRYKSAFEETYGSGWKTVLDTY